MGQNFAGILGFVAFSTTMLRGAFAGHAAEATLLAAILALFAFAAAGWVAGRIAESTIEQSVRLRFESALKAADEENKLQKPA